VVARITSIVGRANCDGSAARSGVWWLEAAILICAHWCTQVTRDAGRRCALSFWQYPSQLVGPSAADRGGLRCAPPRGQIAKCAFSESRGHSDRFIAVRLSMRQNRQRGALSTTGLDAVPFRDRLWSVCVSELDGGGRVDLFLGTPGEASERCSRARRFWPRSSYDDAGWNPCSTSWQALGAFERTARISGPI
jgi:hypothetical protein